MKKDPRKTDESSPRQAFIHVRNLLFVAVWEIFARLKWQMRWDGTTITYGMVVMGWVQEFNSHHELPSHHHHCCGLCSPSIAIRWHVCISYTIPSPGIASHPIHNPPLELSTIPPLTHIQPPRYDRTAVIFESFRLKRVLRAVWAIFTCLEWCRRMPRNRSVWRRDSPT